MSILRDIWRKLVSSRVLENYSYMTALTLISALIGFLIYPYVIRRVGAEAFGLYAFMLALAAYFQILTEYGFDMPATKYVVLHRDDKEALSEIISAVFWSKLALWLAAVAIAVPLMIWIPIVRENSLIFSILLLQLLTTVLYPTWYFQGMKNMRVATYINLAFRLLQVPLIIWLIHRPEDIVLYASIVAGTMVAGGICAFIYVFGQGIRLRIVPRGTFRWLFGEATPFFLTGLTGNIKEKVLTHIIGICFGMREVAVYDLANKVIQIPRIFTQSINQALFPEVAAKATAERVHKILRYERWIGVLFMAGIAAVGYWVILFLGGRELIDAYPIAIILSGTLYTWLITGAYLQFVFIPQDHYRLVLWNQVTALVTCLALAGIGLWCYPGLYAIAGAITLSGVAEIAFCRIACKKYRLL